MVNSKRTAKLLLLGLSFGVLAACDQPGPVDVAATPKFSQTIGATLVECPVDSTITKTATIGLLGGTLSLDGHSITLPSGAVLLPTELTLTVPASNYMEVSITANGQPAFQFQKPVSMTISYARCSRSNIDKAPLSVWYIDGATKTLIENMGGTDDKVARKVTFGSDHLSEYAIAN